MYTQHQPLLKSILEDLLRGKLRSNLFPVLGSPYDGKVQGCKSLLNIKILYKIFLLVIPEIRVKGYLYECLI